MFNRKRIGRTQIEGLRHAKIRADRRARPGLDALEDRQLCTLGGEFTAPVNATTRNAQFASANATNASGTSIVVWTDTFSSTDRDIRAQRFTASGARLGSEIIVASSSLDEGEPSVAINSQGNFVVAWRQRLANGDTNVLARRFSASGSSLGANISVGVGTFAESDPQVAIDSSGGFAVAYTRNTNNNNPDVFAKRYNSAGSLTAVTSVATGTRAENHPSIAMTPDGRFTVAWEEAFSTTDHDIKLAQFSSSGARLTSKTVTSSSVNETDPSLSVDNFNNAVVAWVRHNSSSNDIQARRLFNSGTTGGIIPIASTTANDFNPSVALSRNGGKFVVSYSSASQFITRIKVAEVSAFNGVTTLDAGTRFSAAVSIGGADQYLLTYTSEILGELDIRRRLGRI